MNPFMTGTWFPGHRFYTCMKVVVMLSCVLVKQEERKKHGRCQLAASLDQ